MSRIGDLVRELCPNGVERKSLNEIGTFIRGAGIQKSELSGHGFPAIHYGEIHMKYGISADTVFSHIEKPKTGYKQVQRNDLIIVTTSEDVAGVGKPLAWTGDDSPYVSGETYIFKHTQNAKYLAYLLQDRHFQTNKLTHITGTKVKRIHEAAFAKITFPMPPIEVQDEIVFVLDKFRELQAELEADLEARKIQSSYYKNILLRSDSVPTVQLGELVEVLDNLRKPVSRDKREAGEFPYYGANGIQGYVRDFIFDGTFLLMGEDGSVINPDKSPILQWVEGKIWVNNHAHILQEKSDRASLRYIYYALQMKDVSRLVRGVPPKINQGSMRGIEIALPSLEEQLSIVKMLDTFTELENQISTEVTVRHKQYEHYRSKLLTFEETDVA